MAADVAMLWDYAEAPGFLAPPEFDPETMALAGFEPRSSGQAHGHQPASEILAGALVPAFVADFYDRIHVNPQVMDLGNVISEQQRTVRVWNAWRSARPQDSLTSENDDGITIGGQPEGPLLYGPLQERSYTITVSTDGPAVIGATVTFSFHGLEAITLTIEGTRITAWTWEPDWAQRMLERLEWRTDVLPAYRGEEQRRALRLGPRQALEFSVLAEGDERRHMEAVLWHWSGRVWAVPLWFDGLELEGPLPLGATSIPLDPARRQFAVGDLVMLRGETSRDYEVIEIEALEGAIDLATPTTRDWPVGTRVYPARAARIDGQVGVPRFTGRAASARLRFEMVDPADWTADAGETTYRGYPVFEVPADWSEDPRLELARQLAVLDALTGPVYAEDVARLPLPRLSGRFTLTGRAEIDAWRRRLFALRGKQGAIWVPSWTEDLVPVALVASNATSIDVRWCGFTKHLKGDPNRQDIRIQLTDGTVLYRRVTGGTEIDAATERLSIDAALGVEVPASGFALVSWLTLVRQDSDAAELAWWTGDVVDTACSFRGFRHGE